MHAGKWGYKVTEELFSGDCDTPEEAIAEAVREGITQVTIGQYRDPVSAECFVDASMIFDHIAGQDDYDGDQADFWPYANTEQIAELETELRRVFKAWVEKYGLEPDWVLLDESTVQTIVNESTTDSHA